MGETTGISWTDHTFNPWWGCWKIADECKNCYADTTAARYNPGLWGRTNPRRFFSAEHWNDLRKWNAKAERDGVRRRVFIGSMCDWAERHPVEEINAQLDAARMMTWAMIRQCTALDFLMLTKRPEDAAELLPWSPEMRELRAAQGARKEAGYLFDVGEVDQTPWPNVWVGITAGTVKSMINNVSVLRTIPAVIRFISCEPILEDIPDRVWDSALGRGIDYSRSGDGTGPTPDLGRIHWLIIGDESGPGARPADVAWVERAVAAGKRHGVAVHLKQWAGKVVPPQIADPAGTPSSARKGRKIHLPVLNGKQYAEFPNVTPAK